MYTKGMRSDATKVYQTLKTLGSNFLRYQFPHDYTAPQIVAKFPGPQHLQAMEIADASQSYDNSESVSLMFHKVVLSISPRANFIDLNRFKGSSISRSQKETSSWTLMEM